MKVARKMAMPYMCSALQLLIGSRSSEVRYSAPVCSRRHLVRHGGPSHISGSDPVHLNVASCSPVRLTEVGLTLAEVSSYQHRRYQQDRKQAANTGGSQGSETARQDGRRVATSCRCTKIKSKYPK